jgi:hypothetical protein
LPMCLAFAYVSCLALSRLVFCCLAFLFLSHVTFLALPMCLAFLCLCTWPCIALPCLCALPCAIEWHCDLPFEYAVWPP